MTKLAFVALAATLAAAISAIAPLRSRSAGRAERRDLAIAKGVCVFIVVFAIAYGHRLVADAVGQLLQIAANIGALSALGVFAFLTWEREPRAGDDFRNGWPVGSFINRIAWIVGAALVLAVSVALLADPGVIAKALATHGSDYSDE